MMENEKVMYFEKIGIFRGPVGLEPIFCAIDKDYKLASYIDGSPDYLQMIYGIMQLHLLECNAIANSSDSEYEVIRDYLDISWYALSTEDQERAGEFSSYLSEHFNEK